jgi:hypothetical protein
MGSYYRTEAMRTTHYFANGDGRDSYIFCNNGGVERNTYPFSFKEDGRSLKRKVVASVPSLGAKPINYKTDGTGRDTYIGFNNGGLMAVKNRNTFYNCLRTPEPKPMHFLRRTQTAWECTRKIKEAREQKQTCARLSMPKIYGKV